MAGAEPPRNQPTDSTIAGPYRDHLKPGLNSSREAGTRFFVNLLGNAPICEPNMAPLGYPLPFPAIVFNPSRVQPTCAWISLFVFNSIPSRRELSERRKMFEVKPKT